MVGVCGDGRILLGAGNMYNAAINSGGLDDVIAPPQGSPNIKIKYP